MNKESAAHMRKLHWGSLAGSPGTHKKEEEANTFLHAFFGLSHIGPVIAQFSSVTQFSSVQSLSHVQLFMTMKLSMPGLPVHHQLPESSPTYVHWVGDAIQPSHLLSSPFPPAFTPTQHWGLFKWVSSSHQVAKVLEFQLQHQSFQWTPRTDLL